METYPRSELNNPSTNSGRCSPPINKNQKEQEPECPPNKQIPAQSPENVRNAAFTRLPVSPMPKNIQHRAVRMSLSNLHKKNSRNQLAAAARTPSSRTKRERTPATKTRMKAEHRGATAGQSDPIHGPNRIEEPGLLGPNMRKRGTTLEKESELVTGKGEIEITVEHGGIWERPSSSSWWALRVSGGSSSRRGFWEPRGGFDVGVHGKQLWTCFLTGLLAERVVA